MGDHIRWEYVGVATLTGLWLVFLAAAQPGAIMFIYCLKTNFFFVSRTTKPYYVIAGFLSIDCGGKMNRTDPQTGIQWVTDDNFIHTGEIKKLNDSAIPFYFQTLRLFPKPLNKSCYRLPLTPNLPHLLRIWFGGQNYSIKRNPNFKYSIETREMLVLRNVSTTELPSEKILISSVSIFHVCLIRTSPIDDPFISSIELRSLLAGMYTQVTPDIMLHLHFRYDIGNGLSVVRYPQDLFDRLWQPLSTEGMKIVTSTYAISTDSTENRPPSVVMQTAATTEENRIVLISEKTVIDPLVLLYLAEIEQLHVSESRILNVSVNDAHSPTAVPPNNLYAVQLTFLLRTPLYEFSISKATNSSRGPIINAVEVYQLLRPEPATAPEDS